MKRIKVSVVEATVIVLIGFGAMAVSYTLTRNFYNDVIFAVSIFFMLFPVIFRIDEEGNKDITIGKTTTTNSTKKIKLHPLEAIVIYFSG